jgi:hypothetical protein
MSRGMRMIGIGLRRCGACSLRWATSRPSLPHNMRRCSRLWISTCLSDIAPQPPYCQRREELTGDGSTRCHPSGVPEKWA